MLFSLFFEGASAIVFGTIGIVLSLVEINYILQFNEYYFFNVLRVVVILCIGYGSVMFVLWLYARLIRSEIIKKIHALDISLPD